MLSATSTPWAPWYVIPADRKWFARLCAAAVLAPTLIELDPRYPEVSEQARQQMQAARRELEAEAPCSFDRPPEGEECRRRRRTLRAPLCPPPSRPCPIGARPTGAAPPVTLRRACMARRSRDRARPDPQTGPPWR